MRFRLGMALLAASLLAATPGCRSLMGRGPVSESVANCRSLAAQGMTALDTGDEERADELFQRAITACPTDATARQQYAELLWKQGDQTAARSQIEQAIQIDSANSELQARAGEMYLALGNLDAARARSEAALQIDSQSPRAWALRGRVMSVAGESDLALADLHRALSLAPDSPDLLFDIAELHRRRGQPQRALVVLQQITRLHTPGEEPQRVLHLMGQAYLALDRREDAREILYSASIRGPANAELLHDLALAEWQCGRNERAMDHAQRALALDPQHEPSQRLATELQANTRIASRP